MQLIDFNSKKFKGFNENEEILLDTGVIFAYLNEYDVWHTTIKELFEKHILNVLDGDKDSVLKQIKLSSKLGAADAVNATIADTYGINFLTVDRKLANNMKEAEKELEDIDKVYYTTGNHRDY